MLTHLLERAVRRSNALDTESLCILAGQKCWNVRADVHVLDFDGGLVDASCIALVAALRHFRKPDIKTDGEDVNVYSSTERTPLPLSLLHHPFCVTLSFFHEGELVLVDATWLEQQMSDGEMVITVNAQGEVCQIAKLGGVPTEALLLLRCLDMAAAKAQALNSIVTHAMEQEEVARIPKTLVAELQSENKR